VPSFFIAPTVMACGLFPGEHNGTVAVSVRSCRPLLTTTIPFFKPLPRLGTVGHVALFAKSASQRQVYDPYVVFALELYCFFMAAITTRSLLAPF